jgi:hypothetical protein
MQFGWCTRLRKDGGLDAMNGGFESIEAELEFVVLGPANILVTATRQDRRDPESHDGKTYTGSMTCH